MARHYEEKNSRGHGGCGFVLTLILVLLVIGGILFFTTNLFSGYKNKLMANFYSQKYSEYVSKYSKEFGVDEALVYSVIRCESGFREDVESHAGAIGLMQLMPETFTWLQMNKDGEETYSASDLQNPEINIEYGTYYLSWLLNKYGVENTAVAAYNAGVTNVDDWLSNTAYSSDGKTLSTIPYHETDEYVSKVENTKKMYEEIYYQK
ncbi:MAG: lytic transglycosylase domain-containing protein [Ruminococcus sp.]|nr:lytic transglycosylase domain-containing protein [Ruminococcus sp.]